MPQRGVFEVIWLNRCDRFDVIGAGGWCDAGPKVAPLAALDEIHANKQQGRAAEPRWGYGILRKTE